MKSKSSAILLIGLGLAAAAHAKPLNQNYVPQSARWIVHVNTQAFWDSQLGSFALDALGEKEQTQLSALNTLVGSDLIKDLYGITLYGADDDDKKAVLMVHGKFNQQQLLSFIKLKDTYKELAHQGQIIYLWQDEKDDHAQHGSFARDDLVVISQSRSSVAQALDVLQGKTDTIAQGSAFAALKAGDRNSIAVACAEELADLTKDQANAAMLQHATMFALAIGEQEGQLSAEVQLKTKTTEAAQQIEQMAKGMLALVSLQQNQHPELASLISACNISNNNGTVVFTVTLPAQAIFTLAEKHAKDKLK
jgi:hypothetical protein